MEFAILYKILNSTKELILTALITKTLCGPKHYMLAFID